MNRWSNCKNILCIRPDNMGDLIMSAPAIRALKETFDANITVLTSSAAQGIAKHIAEVDDVIVYDLPWVKTAGVPDRERFNELTDTLAKKNFDAAIIFTVYSQNPLPAAMLAYLAGVPRILAYCRENPYHLLTDWVPDKEPYQHIKHQVQRDLDLVAVVGATTVNTALGVKVDERLRTGVLAKMLQRGIYINRPWLILHAGVSEKKRMYPNRLWIEAAKQLITNNGYQVLFTGSAAEKELTDILEQQTGPGSFSVAGMFGLDEFIWLVKQSPVLISVNTGTVHIAAAVGTPVVVLYAQTNPQHTPWQVPCKVLQFPVPAHLRSSNEVIAYVNKTLYHVPTGVPGAGDIINAVRELLNRPPGSPSPPSREIPSESQALPAS
ncbi:glycosyltransferase family 9 protein [Mucilaginibacter hurinus]|uniref:Glycosyltransferase family 9 protein n=1 Tax=Mucilaginibacter hurinus TaxID=2201324 RepID=A0A367GR17_9SPHI|nr:glycosyltransferase family 9 protein [Mucilaginibacter hurinus]RCH55316.1 glycosyltransferase family 9 protein [Mucilaginibacter hurinus]